MAELLYHLQCYYPEKVNSLILESASPGLKTEEERKARMKQDEYLAEMIQTKGIEEFVSYWENIPLFETQKNLPKDSSRSSSCGTTYATEKGLAESLLYMGTGMQPSWWDYLSESNTTSSINCR